MKSKVLSGWWCCFILISIFLFWIFLFQINFASQSPSWSGSKVGRVDKVLKPWVPVMATKKSISCWGREYIWGKMPFPDRIMTQGKDILSEPIHLQAMINGKEVNWEGEKVLSVPLVSTAGTSASIIRSAAGAGLRLESTATVEFDGMVRIDFELKPGSAPVKVDSFIIEIPYRKECATLLHYWPMPDGNYISNSGEAPRNPFASDFRPVWWLGNEEGGLCWFGESDQGWSPAEKNHAIEIISRRDDVLFRLHVWDLPRTLNQSQKFTMGLHATPVKPWPDDAQRRFISGNLWYGCQSEERQKNYGTVVDANWLDYQKKMGVTDLNFGSDWTDIQAYITPALPDEFRRIIEQAHERGMTAVPYFGFEISDIAPEWAEYSQEVINPHNPSRFHVTKTYSSTMPDQTAYPVCYKSHWADFIINGMERLKKEYGIDGVYLDATTAPEGCTNQLHGCGYVAEDGSIKPTYPIFAVRDLMKRINVLFAQDSGGIIIAHHSSGPTIPTMSFATIHMDAEHMTNMKRTDPIETLPLAAFRVEFMGRNWGIPCLMLQPFQPMDLNELLSISLLHDVIPRTDMTIPGLARIAVYKHLFRDFGTDHAEWLPYWRNKDYVSTSHHENIKVSLYQRKDNKLLLIVSNLHKQDLEKAEITLNLKNLGMTAAITATDAIQNSQVDVNDGVIVLPLPGYSPRLILVQ